MHPLWQLTLARLRLFVREPGAVFWSFGFPLLLAVALGIAFRARPPDPSLVAVGTEEMRAALARDPQIRPLLLDDPAARAALRTGKVDLIVQPGPVYVYDPVRPESRLARALADAALHPRASDAVDRRVTEPGSRYIDFLIPGLIGMSLMSNSMWGIGYSIVEMRNKKLLKRLVATPMSRAHFLWSFVAMRMVFLCIELPALIVFARLVFGIAIAGSLALLLATGLLGTVAFSGISLLLASRAQNTYTVTGLMNAVMMPMFIGSGVFFSTARFPDSLQLPLRVLPLTALNDALRGIMIEGAGLRAVALQLALLACFGLASFVTALRLFRWR